MRIVFIALCITISLSASANEKQWLTLDNDCSVLSSHDVINFPILNLLELAERDLLGQYRKRSGKTNMFFSSHRFHRARKFIIAAELTGADRELAISLKTIMLSANKGSISYYAFGQLKGVKEEVPSLFDYDIVSRPKKERELVIKSAIYFEDGIYSNIEELAKKNNPIAQQCIGLIHFFGIGKSRDLVQSYAWLKIADIELNPEGSDFFWYLDKRLTWEEKEEAYDLYKIYLREYTDYYDHPIGVIIN